MLRWVLVGVAVTAAATRARAAEAERGGAQEVAVLAGGCFWGMQEILRKVPGVVTTEVGYAASRAASVRFEGSGGGDRAEAVRIVFDPSKLSYEDLLERWFFRMHDPTTRDRQGNDVGRRYRSAIFYLAAEQKTAAERVKDRVDRSGKWQAPLVTEIVRLGSWVRAEAQHQDYLQKNPHGYTCHFLRPG